MLEQFCSNSLCCNMFDMLILTIWPLKTSRLANQALGYVKRLHAFYPFLRSNTWTRWINLLKIWADVPSTAPASCAHNEVLRARISILHIDDASQNSMYDLNFWSDVSPDYCKHVWHCYVIWSSKVKSLMAYKKFSGKKRNSKLLIGTMYHLERILDT